MENIQQNSNEKIWPENLFEMNDIVALGEAHGKNDESILSLIEQFSSKINGIFYEYPINLQQSIDLYLGTGEISENLESAFKGAEKEGHMRDGVLKILNKLRELNIKVICIDSSKIKTAEYKTKSVYGYYFLRGESRDEDMFNNIMTYYGAHPGKYAIVCGANHLAERKHFYRGEDTLTLGARLNDAIPEKSESIMLV